jgi:hypothetical protein
VCPSFYFEVRQVRHPRKRQRNTDLGCLTLSRCLASLWFCCLGDRRAELRNTRFLAMGGPDQRGAPGGGSCRLLVARCNNNNQERSRRSRRERSPNHSQRWVTLLYNFVARTAVPPLWTKMRASDGAVTSSRFERRLPGGQHKFAFKLAFGSYGAAARALGVSRMTVYRWSHDLTLLPRYVAETLADIVQDKVLDAHAAQNHLRDFLALPEKPPCPLSGACAGYSRKPKKSTFD